MKKVLIVAHFCDYANEQSNNRFNYIADLLAKEGNQVNIVTSSFCHRTKQQREKVEKVYANYDVDLIFEPSYRNNISIKRLFYSHKLFARNLKKYLNSIEKPDVVYAAVPSNDAGAVAAEYCKKNSIPLIIDIQDLWPEAFKLGFNVPVLSVIIFAPMAYQANKFYAQAEKIVAVSETYMKRGLKTCKKDKEGLSVFLGTDIDTFDEAAQKANIQKPEDEIWITYVCTFGHSYNIEIIIDALKLLPKETKKGLVFKVLGDGPLLERFKAYAEESGEAVEFFGRLPYEEMVGFLTASDIAVNPISKGAAQSIINKHGDYAMAGLPVVSTQESEEYMALIKDNDCGINCGVNSHEEVAEAIKKFVDDEELRRRMGEKSRKIGEEKFNRKQSYRKIVELIENM